MVAAHASWRYVGLLCAVDGEMVKTYFERGLGVDIVEPT